MTYDDLKNLAEWHETEAKDHFANAELFGDATTGAEMRAAAEQHQEWSNQLRALLCTDEQQLADMALEQARHGVAMTAKVVFAMEQERRKLCTEIAVLKMEAEKSK